MLTKGGGKCQIVSRKDSKVEKKEHVNTENVPIHGGFVGHFRHSLDPKKRLTIPSEWREHVGAPLSLYVLPGLHDEKCLLIYPAIEMVQRFEKFRKIGVADKKARVFARTLAYRSDLVIWDSQGRIRIKDELLQYAELTSQVEFVGAWDRFELWNPEQWKAAADIDHATMEDAVRYVDF